MCLYFIIHGRLQPQRNGWRLKKNYFSTDNASSVPTYLDGRTQFVRASVTSSIIVAAGMSLNRQSRRHNYNEPHIGCVSVLWCEILCEYDGPSVRTMTQNAQSSSGYYGPPDVGVRQTSIYFFILKTPPPRTPLLLAPWRTDVIGWVMKTEHIELTVCCRQLLLLLLLLLQTVASLFSLSWQWMSTQQRVNVSWACIDVQQFPYLDNTSFFEPTHATYYLGSGTVCCLI